MTRAREARRSKRHASGFTLIELMVTVAIVGVLATLAVYGVGKYIRSSKSSEAIQMIGSIKAAQEQYRAETFAYKDPNGDHTLTYYPATTPSNQAVAWGVASPGQGAAFRELGVRPDAPVRFVYGCAAGGGNDSVPGAGTSYTVTGWPTTQTQPWYVVRAAGDLDADGTQSIFVSASFVDRIFIDNEGE